MREHGIRLRERQTGKAFRDEQRDAIFHMTGNRQLTCLVGRAGTGKSFTVGAVKAIYASQGFNLWGVALSSVAAEGLRQDAGLESSTIASLKFSIERGFKTLNAHDVILMDEAGMTDVDSMQFMLEETAKAGAKLILMGDPDQLQPVGAGAIFRAILERVGFSEITEIFRQVENWQKVATMDFAKGDTEKALRAYEAKGCIHLEKTEIDAMNALVSSWRACYLTQQDLSQLMVVAHENKDVTALNHALRNVLIEEKVLQKEGYGFHTKDKHLTLVNGERLVFLKNDRKLGVSNGSVGTVTSIDFLETGQVKSFTVRLDGQEKELRINAADYCAVDYGYATTVHKSQGATKAHAFIYVSGNLWDRAMTYVAMSRHRLTAHLYAAASQFPSLSDVYQSLGKHAVKDSVLNYPLHFAMRRGIEPLAKGLASHLAKNLRQIKTRLFDAVQKRVHPDLHEARLAQDVAQSARDSRRLEAVQVAQYKDICVDAGKIWAKMLGTLNAQGIDSQSLKFFDALKALPEYPNYHEKVMERDRIAATIYPDKEKYALALELNRVAVKKLQGHATAHTLRVQVKAYQDALLSHHLILAQKRAFLLTPLLQKNYALFKAMNVNTAALSKHAKAFEIRLYRKGLTALERTSFDRVASYQDCLKASAPLLGFVS